MILNERKDAIEPLWRYKNVFDYYITCQTAGDTNTPINPVLMFHKGQWVAVPKKTHFFRSSVIASNSKFGKRLSAKNLAAAATGSPPKANGDVRRPPLQNRSNFQEGGSLLEEQRAARRDEERERHAALQETPSRRRRRVPRPNDENRPVSPTPRSSRSSQFFLPANAPLPTPPDTQRAAGTQGEDNGQTNATNSGTAPYSTPPLTQTAPRNQGRQSAAPAAGPSRRSLAQLARQERERAQREQAALQQQQQARPAGAADPPNNPPPQPEQQQQPPDAGGPPAAVTAAPLHACQNIPDTNKLVARHAADAKY
ncbi:hypothetical protein R3P38DRAFT_2771967 [Favolaschia claudopus]|uniref:Uncharacterized protein n=1 Tax=Favolaschia claudopus TaxID=2862362 RepID=A0AAW0C7Y8_9AGAR